MYGNDNALTLLVFALLFALAVSAPSLADDAPAATPTPATLPTTADQPFSIFCIGSSSAGGNIHPKWLPQMAAIGIRDLRSFYGCWRVEKEEGTFDFTIFDERLTYDEYIGVRPGLLFNGLPPWKRSTNRGLPVNCLPEWSAMVKELVAHTKGRITTFECWNEPPNGTDQEQTGVDYAKMLCATYDAAKAANPEAMVVMAAKSVHITYLDQALTAGAKGHYDAISFHPYEVLGCVVDHPGTEPVYLSIVPNVRKMLAARDPEKIKVPVFITEVGFDSRRGVEKQAQAVLKAYIMGIHQGIARIYLYEGMDGDSGPLGLLDHTATPRPSYHALGRLIESVGRYPVSLGWVMLNDRHYGFMIQGDKGPVLATWAATTQPETVDFGQQVNILDPVTGTTTPTDKIELTLRPILVLNPPEKMVELAKANKSKPIPWGGDFSNAKSVSVTFGDPYVEQGLHTMAADSIAANVVAYGGNQRAGQVPKGGNVFYVDPNFLSYETVPIEITAMVKRNEKGDPISLSFEYESNQFSRHGYQKVEPQDIPENTSQWHKLTWKIDDCQFVGTWAFHFRIQTDARKYRMQSLTVTRLDR